MHRNAWLLLYKQSETKKFSRRQSNYYIINTLFPVFSVSCSFFRDILSFNWQSKQGMMRGKYRFLRRRRGICPAVATAALAGSGVTYKQRHWRHFAYSCTAVRHIIGNGSSEDYPGSYQCWWREMLVNYWKRKAERSTRKTFTLGLHITFCLKNVCRYVKFN